MTEIQEIRSENSSKTSVLEGAVRTSYFRLSFGSTYPLKKRTPWARNTVIKPGMGLSTQIWGKSCASEVRRGVSRSPRTYDVTFMKFTTKRRRRRKGGESRVNHRLQE